MFFDIFLNLSCNCNFLLDLHHHHMVLLKGRLLPPIEIYAFVPHQNILRYGQHDTLHPIEL